MNYQIIIETKVDKETRKIPKSDMQKIDQTIFTLGNNPRPKGCLKLTDKEGYRIRVGNYRILYKIDDKSKIVIIYRIKRKSETTYK